MTARQPGWLRWSRRLLVAGGTLLIGYALYRAVTDGGIKPLPQLTFLGVLLIGHDAVFLPVVIAVGAVIGRYVPVSARTVVRIALVASLAVTVVALPFVGGRGRRADDPSALPLNYGRGLFIVLAAVWLAAGVTLAVGRWRRRRADADHSPA
jgi:hypothetical protein